MNLISKIEMNQYQTAPIFIEIIGLEKIVGADEFTINIIIL